jgi:hypothetical protein
LEKNAALCLLCLCVLFFLIANLTLLPADIVVCAGSSLLCVRETTSTAAAAAIELLYA